VETADEEFVKWSLKVSRIDPPEIATLQTYSHPGIGYEALAFEDLSDEANITMSKTGRIVWRATLEHRSLSDARYIAFVEDAMVQRHIACHIDSSCSFVRSWKAFNKEHQGRSHSTLVLCQKLLKLFLPLAACAIYLVASLHVKQLLRPKHGFGCCFHFIVIAKFLVVDVAQQTCIVLYILGWYNTDGLRCQMCFLQDETADSLMVRSSGLEPSSLALACSLLSSISNQMLLRPAERRVANSDDVCVRITARMALASVSTLPFTTGVWWASSALLEAPTTIRGFVVVPCILGWTTLGALSLMFLVFVCENCGS